MGLAELERRLVQPGRQSNVVELEALETFFRLDGLEPLRLEALATLRLELVELELERRLGLDEPVTELDRLVQLSLEPLAALLELVDHLRVVLVLLDDLVEVRVESVDLVLEDLFELDAVVAGAVFVVLDEAK